MESAPSTLAYEAFSSTLAPAERCRFLQQVARLEQQAESAESMMEFLTEFGETVAELFAATSVGIWFQTPGETAQPWPSQPKVSVGWKNLGLDEESKSAHLHLVRQAFAQLDPIAVHPFSAAPQTESPASNPTDSFILLGPVRYEQYTVAVLEIALGPKPLRRPHRELVDSYLEWIGWLGGLLQAGIQRCFTNASQPMLVALETVQQASQQAKAMQNQIRLGIEASLRTLAGQNFGSLQENQTVVKRIHELLESKALRVQCPECGNASILRCQKAGNSKTGAFMYDHYLDTGRTFHGGQTTFPNVTLISKPARRQKR